MLKHLLNNKFNRNLSKQKTKLMKRGWFQDIQLDLITVLNRVKITVSPAKVVHYRPNPMYGLKFRLKYFFNRTRHSLDTTEHHTQVKRFYLEQAPGKDCVYSRQDSVYSIF